MVRSTPTSNINRRYGLKEKTNESLSKKKNPLKEQMFPPSPILFTEIRATGTKIIGHGDGMAKDQRVFGP